MHEHIRNGQLDYNYITDGIYMGSNQCCVLGLAEVLKKEGITVDISLEEIRVDQPFGVEAYLWLPTPDHTPPTQDQLMLGAMTLVTLVKQGKKVYVHCKNGHGRATTLVTAYLLMTGKTLEDSVNIIKEHRPTIHLQDSQLSFLDEFQKTLLKNTQ